MPRTQVPSHRKSTNERRERNAIHKSAVKLSPAHILAAATVRIEREAARITDADIKTTDSGFVINLGLNHFKQIFTGKDGSPSCYCIDQTKYKNCAHVVAVRRFAADAVAVESECEKRFTARLEYGNRKGHDFSKEEKFATQKAATDWLVKEAFDKFQPEGFVTDNCGETVFEVTNEFFDLWADV